MDKPISGMRKEYSLLGLRREDLASDPMTQFDRWFDDAIRADVHEPSAMALSTVDADGAPASRMVLLKGVGPGGFTFYTSFDSRKGVALAADVRAALCFWWADLERQVRVEGDVARVSDEESDAYFQTRPLESQLGACASPQGAVVASREELEKRLESLQAKYRDKPVPRPANWGGFRLRPSTIEFWQGRPCRLHDRLRYMRQPDDSWYIERLAP